MSKYIIRNVPYIYGGIVPCCHVTSLRMILEHYGIKYSPSYLMNLCGFNYGFSYIREENLAVACPEFEPWDYMFYAAEKIGCKITFVKDKPWDETWELLKSYVAKDAPVYMPLLNMKSLWKTASAIPHVVVLCGYDEKKGLVMIHDPALGEIGEGIQYLSPNELPEGKSGSYAEFRIEDFRKACDLKGSPWEHFGKNALCVIKPPTERLSISWAEVVDRNAKLTMGQVEETSKKPANRLFGPKGIIALADDLEKAFGLLKEPGNFFEVIRMLRIMTFTIGCSQRMDASAFVAGLAALTGSQDLETASYYLRLTGLCYEQGLAQIDYIMHDQSISQEALRKKLTRISEVLRRAAEYERKAGENLSKGRLLTRLIA